MSASQVDQQRQEAERLARAWIAIYGTDASWHAKQKAAELSDWGDERGAARLREVARAIRREPSTVVGWFRRQFPGVDAGH